MPPQAWNQTAADRSPARPAAATDATLAPTAPVPGDSRAALWVGGVRLDNRVLLAPMAGVTDRPFRTLCRRLGAGLAVSEMLTANPALRGTRKSIERADHAGEPGPIAVQIAGSDPVRMADAARCSVDGGAEIIDINMGCPAKQVCRLAAGSALLRDEALVGRILEAVTRAVSVPVTLKTRTGWSPATRNLARIAHIACASGIAMLVVHGRTRACGYSGSAEFESLRALRDAPALAGLVLVANGDIDSPRRAREVLRDTGADAVMIGRAARGRPWIFRDINHYLSTGRLLPEPAPDWIRDTLLGHLEALYAFYGETRGVRIARKHIGWYCRGSRPFRLSAAPGPGRNIGQAAVRDQRAAVEQFLDRINSAETARQQLMRTRSCFDESLPMEDVA